MDAPLNLSKTFAELEARKLNNTFMPQMANNASALYIALTAVILAYASLFGAIPIIILYGIWLPKYRYKGVLTLRLTKDTLVTLIIPLCAIVSTIWSDFRPNSIYSALEFTSIIICTLIISKIVPLESFIRGIIWGTTAALIMSLISGKYGGDPFSGQYSLVGLFGSKNMVGIYAEVGLLFASLRVALSPRKIFSCLIPLGVCAVSLYLSKSASSVLSLGLTYGILALLYFNSKLPRTIRKFALVSSLLLVTSLTVMTFTLGLQAVVLKSFGKDSTMSGRTVLWNHGIAIGEEAPFLGHGYSAFWVQGNPGAENLWYEFKISGRTGFHFHNLYIELLVELGGLGIILMAVSIISNISRAANLAMKHGLIMPIVFPLATALMFFIRSFVEVDLIGTFSLAHVLYFSIIPRLSNFRDSLITASPTHTTAP